MIRNALFASIIALGAAGAANAQDRGPQLVGGGVDAQVAYSQPSRNVVGGGFARVTGGGDDRRIAYGTGVTTEASDGTVARLVGGGEDAQLVRERLAPAGSMMAGGAAQPRG